MRLFAFFGHSGTGKTTLLEKLSEQFKDEGYRVGYLKLTRHKGSFDKEGKDTFRISQKGVRKIALLHDEGSVLWEYNPRDQIDFIKKHFIGFDFLFIEGNPSIYVPKMQCIKDKMETVENDPLVLYTCSFNNEGDLHIDRDFNRIYEIVKSKAMPLLPHLDCGECGYKTCLEFARSYLKDEVKLKDCKILSKNAVSVWVDGKRIEMKSFVQDFLGSTIIGALSSLRGFEEGGHIRIRVDMETLKNLKKEGI